MVRKDRASPENHGKIVKSYSQSQIAERVDCSQKTVSNIMRRQQKAGNTKTKRIPGRPRITSMRDDRQLIRILLSNQQLNAPWLGPNYCRPMEQTFPPPPLKDISEKVDCLTALLDRFHALQLSIAFATSHLHRTTETGQPTIGHA